MIEITVDTRRATVTNRELLTSGSYGIGVQFTLSDDWAGLVKTACFRNGDDSETQIDIAMGSSVMCYLPTEICDEKYVDETVYAGIYGTDGNGNLIIPTIWVSIGALRQGVKPGYAEGPAPTPDMWAQIQAIAMSAGEENAEAAAQSAEAASDSADDAAASATEAAGYATAASESAETASGYAEAAGSSASDAADSATAAAVSAGDASTAQTAAETAQTAAETAQSLAETAQAAAEAAQAFLENASATATTLEPGSSATASYEDGVFTFGIPKGDPGDPATNLVTSVNGETGAVVLDATDVGAYALPSGGIPKTDLASAVQTSLGKADTALQTAPVTSVNTQTGDVVLDAGDIAYESTTVEEELGTINSALTSLQSVTEIIDTASGAIASFPDGAGTPMRSLLAQIEPQQDLHGYDAPWAGGAGKNLINQDGTDTNNGYVHKAYINTSGTVSQAEGNWDVMEYVPVEPNTTYTLSGVTASGSSGWVEYNANKETVSVATANNIPLTFTTGASTRYVRFNRKYDTDTQVQLEKGSSATAYQPFANICPITGWTGLSGKRDGKNLFDTATAGNEWVTSGGYITTKDSAKSVRLDCKSGEVFTLSNKNTASATNILVIACFDANNTMLSREVVSSTTKSVTATVPNRASFLIACFNDWSLVDEAQLEVGSSATEYEAPVTSLPITCTWQTEAGTVYDGYIDVVSGLLTAEVGKYNVTGTEDVQTQNGYFRLFRAISGAREDATKTICSDYPVASTFSRTSMYLAVNASGQGTVYFPLDESSRFADITAFKAYLASRYQANNPVEIIYPLAEAQTYQLTPQQISTLLGNNTVFVDTGSVSVTYQASIKGYIDKVLGA